jgi:hypothetical protein
MDIDVAQAKISKKLDPKKNRKSELALTPDELGELEMIVDRLSVQNPEGATFDNYLKSLVKTLNTQETLAVALLEQLSRKPSQVGFRTFLALRDLIRDKKLVKIVKQVGYRFSQRGFASEPEALLAENVVLVQKEGRKPVAHVLPVDGTFWLFAALIPEAGYPTPTLITAFMERDFEEVYIKVTEGSQKIYRDYLQKMGERHADRKPCEVPLYHVSRLFFELLDFCNSKEASAVRDQARKLLSPFHDPEKPPLAHALMPPVDDLRGHIEELDTGNLLNSVDWSWLVFPKIELTPYWQKVQELENPVLVIPKEIQEERTADLLKHAADELCAGKPRFLYQRFFEEQALWLKLCSREELALSAWIVAQHLLSDAPASDNPAVREMVKLSMHYHWPKEFEAAEPRTEPFQRTESGLIIPS